MLPPEHGCTHAQTNRQLKNIMPPDPSTGWEDKKLCYRKDSKIPKNQDMFNVANAVQCNEQ